MTGNTVKFHRAPKFFFVDPSSTTDASKGYGVGDFACSTLGALSLCTDATIGAAVWKQVAFADIDSGSTGTTAALLSQVTIFAPAYNANGTVCGYIPILTAAQVSMD